MPCPSWEACEKSLKDLGIDNIDLYYQHRVDPNTPIEETVKAMAVCSLSMRHFCQSFSSWLLALARG